MLLLSVLSIFCFLPARGRLPGAFVLGSTRAQGAKVEKCGVLSTAAGTETNSTVAYFVSLFHPHPGLQAGFNLLDLEKLVMPVPRLLLRLLFTH